MPHGQISNGKQDNAALAFVNTVVRVKATVKSQCVQFFEIGLFASMPGMVLKV